MFELMILIFVIGYLAIAFEHPLHIDKSASALLTGALCWTAFAVGSDVILAANPDFLAAMAEKAGYDAPHHITHELGHHLTSIAEILFFLLGAMTIVELMDAHEGFAIITDKINTTSRVTLLWIIGILTFFLSSVLDNLTTAIVMTALVKKLLDKSDLPYFGGVIIIAANAGGAWSPIGDVTTIMLWIGGQVTTGTIMAHLIVPSLVCLFIPLLVMTPKMRGTISLPEKSAGLHDEHQFSAFERNVVFVFGLGALLFVPVFKTITHLPPYVGILLGLGVLWLATELLHKHKSTEARVRLSVGGVLRRIDTPSVLFFLGILLAVGALQSAGHLGLMAAGLDSSIGNIYAIDVIIGMLSAVIDNVPLVAGAMGMYDLLPLGSEAIAGQGFPVDHDFWIFLAYCAGTGGSCLIIGSAAGVAVMGLMKIDFLWYLKNISLPAVLGYLGGCATYYAMFVL